MKPKHNQNTNKIKNIKVYLKGPIVIPGGASKLIPFECEIPGDYIHLGKEIDTGIVTESNLINIDDDQRGEVNIHNNTANGIVLGNTWVELENTEEYVILGVGSFGESCSRRTEILEKLKTGNMDSWESQSIASLCNEFSDVFHLEEEVLSYADVVRHKIPTTTDVPVHVRQYRLPMAQRQEINKKIDKMLGDGIIRPSSSPWNSPTLLVSKKSESGEPKWRLVIDYRKLNSITVKESFPLPNITDILDQLGNASYFSTLDLASGYHQLLMDDEDREKTAFSTDSNHYEWNRLPMGLVGASMTFQRLMNNILRGLIGRDCFVYLDDIVIYGRDLSDHNNKLRRVLETLRKYNLKLQTEKCKLLQKSVVYLGHLITAEGIKPDPAKTSCVTGFPVPKNPKNIKSFLGLVGYYRRFIKNFAGLAKPLTSLLKKGRKFIWDAECQEAFDLFKEKLTSPPLLQYPDFNREFILTTDASTFAIGAILSQGPVGRDRPIAFASKTLLDAETRYTTTEQEMLAIVWGISQFRPYLWGRKFKIITDHQPLVWIFGVKDPSSRLMRWRIKLEEYDYEVVYKKGKLNCNADALSRIPIEEKEVLVLTRAQTNAAKEAKILPNDENEPEEENRDTLINNDNNQTTRQKPGSKVETRVLDWETEHVENKIHFVTPHADILKMLEGEAGTNFEMGEVIHKQRKRGHDLYLIIKDPITCDIKFEELFMALRVARDIMEELGIQRVGIIKAESTFENLSEDCVRRMLETIFSDSDINITIHTRRVQEINKTEDAELITKQMHHGKTGGHLGVKRLERKMKLYYEFPNMRTTIENIIKRCEKCQKNKYGRTTKMPMAITSTARVPFERVALDIVGPLPETAMGNKYLLTFQDDLTKYVEAIPLENQEADTVARMFTQHIVLRHSAPLGVLTDSGSNFVSDLFSRVCKLLGINRSLATPYHPETNGALERTHRTFKEFLRSYVNVELDDWDNWSQYAVYTYNTTPHTSTKFSPYELLYGFRPNLPGNLKTKPQAVYNYDNFLFELRYRLQKSHTIARENQIQNKIKSKQHYDKTTFTPKFRVGDLVLMENCSLRGQGRKLQPLYIGPFNIVSTPTELNSEIQIKNNKTKMVHNNLLKPFHT